MDMYLRMRWRDDRLSHQEEGAVMFNDLSVIRRLWLPDLYIANSKKTYFHLVTEPNQSLKILPDGTIHYSIR